MKKKILKRKSAISLITLFAIAFAMIIMTNCSSNASQANNDSSLSTNNKTENVVPVDGQPVIENVVVEKATDLSDKDFYTTINSGVVLVDFWATWCAPCRQQGPIVDEVAKAMGGKATVGKINVDQFNSISAQYDVRNIPTIIIFKDGKAVQRFVGVQSKEYLISQIESLL